jgi:AraC family transcriptional regulator
MSDLIRLGHFVGAPAHAQAYEGVSIAESTYALGTVVAPHAHDAALITLVLSGDSTEENRGRSRNLEAQTLLFTPSHEMHGHLFRNAGRWLNMQVSDAWLTRVAAGSAPLPVLPQLVKNHTAVAWATRIRNELRQHDAVSQLAIEGALLLLLTDLSRIEKSAERTRPRWLVAVENAIEASVAAPPTIDDLATMTGVHASHLLRTFRRYNGMTIANYVRKRRIERARADIAVAKRTLSEIAADAGFADQSHFTRVFRQTYGETPGQYARSLRGR